MCSVPDGRRHLAVVVYLSGPGARHGMESLIEGLDLAHAAPAATGKVTEVPGAQAGILFMELPGQGDVLFFQRPHFHPKPAD